MGVLGRRIFVISLGGLIGASAVGLLAPNATVFVLGILALGVGLILGILFYLLRPIQDVPLVDLQEFSEATLTPAPAPVRETANRFLRTQRSADIIPFPHAPE